jgi:hypothetical protein
VDASVHRVFADFQGRQVPVMSIEYEWRAYGRLGRIERAALLKRYVLSGEQDPAAEVQSVACRAAGGPSAADSHLRER